MVAIDLNEDISKRKVIVFFANSPDGHLLADDIIFPNVKIKHGLDYFFLKWGFAKKIEDNWREMQTDRICEIILKNERDLVNLQDNNKLIIDIAPTSLTITCYPELAFIMARVIRNKFDEFQKNNPDMSCSIKDSKDEKGNMIMKVWIKNDTMCHQFIDSLKAEKILPPEKVTPNSYKKMGM